MYAKPFLKALMMSSADLVAVGTMASFLLKVSALVSGTQVLKEEQVRLVLVLGMVCHPGVELGGPLFQVEVLALVLLYLFKRNFGTPQLRLLIYFLQYTGVSEKVT